MLPLHRHLQRRWANAIGERLQALRRRTGRQARRARDRVLQVDDESDPAKAVDNVNKLIKRDNVVLVGTVHSGVAMAAGGWETGTPADGAQCRRRRGDRRDVCAQHLPPSFSNWQTGYARWPVMATKGHKNAVSITWKYAGGDEMVRGFRRPSRRAAARSLAKGAYPSPTSSSRPC